MALNKIMVYFVLDKTSKALKIGYTNSELSLERRLNQLQNGNPNYLHLIGSIKAGRLIEKQLHQRFKWFRLRREWFGLPTKVISEIKKAVVNENRDIINKLELFDRKELGKKEKWKTNEILNIKEVSYFLGTKPHLLERHFIDHGLPHVFHNGNYYFNRTEIDCWLNDS